MWSPRSSMFNPYPFRNRCSNRWTKLFQTFQCYLNTHMKMHPTSMNQSLGVFSTHHFNQQHPDYSQSLRQVGNWNSEWTKRLSAQKAVLGSSRNVWRRLAPAKLPPSAWDQVPWPPFMALPQNLLPAKAAHRRKRFCESEGRPSAGHRQRQRKGALRSALAAWNDSWSRQTATPQSYTGISTSHS